MDYEFIHRFRAWADNEEYVIPIFRGKSEGDLFAEKIVREIGEIMEREKFHFQNRVLIPTLYTVFISQEDAWTGKKKDSLSRKLNDYVENCLRMTSTETFNKNFVQIQTAQEIKKGEIIVKHFWEDSELPVEIRFNGSHKTNEQQSEDFSENTIISSAIWETEFEYSDVDYETVIRPNLKKLFSLEIRRNGVFQKVPIYQPKCNIGRGSASVVMDIQLRDDLEISRHHAVLQMESDGTFNLLAIGKNSIIVRETTTLFAGQTTSCVFGETFKIGSYSLTMKG